MRKMDEMEMNINLKAIKWAWLYTVLFLLIWTMYDYIKQGILNVAFFLLLTQSIVYLLINQFLKWKWGKDEK
ncbi:hypothetical protein [Methanosarcina mazei]|uniref:Uncharacterized protein n=1 Tax=Methanosarcina mazei TaxID=2209 RepID=A0A0F8PW75_METMZ|nr:hypothetical protein [Methanosarcina mazei]KKG66243.1 hypothetical protein DU67_09635 [Methanosarcina mazei]KKH57615.1 hypothetical protein DU74_09255 [Methanosarcina mazei]